MNKDYKMTANKFADQTHEEFSNKFLAPIGKKKEIPENEEQEKNETENIQKDDEGEQIENEENDNNGY